MTLLAIATLRVSSVLLCALGSARLLHRHSASRRHAVLATGVCCALLVAPLSLLLPAWTFPQADATATMRVAPRVATDTATTGAATTSETTFEGVVGVGGSEATVGSSADWLVREVGIAVWALGSVLCGLMVLGGLLRLWFVRACGEHITSGTWHEQLHLKAQHDPRLRHVRLVRGDTSMLATFGTLRPVIVVPRDADGWAPQRIAIVLEHETAHIRGRHALLQVVGQVVSAVFWFNPLVWIAASRMRIESERVCDDHVISSGVAPEDYATELVNLARSLTARAWLPAPAMARPSSLERRVTAMLDPSVRRTPVTTVIQRVVIAVSLALTATIASFAAQDTFARLSGTLHDPLGGTLPGGTVALTHQQSGTKYEVKSNASGSFDIVGLQAGTYTVKMYAPGFESSEQSLQLTAGQVARRDATLAIGTLQETISLVDGATSVARNRPMSASAPDSSICTTQPNSGGLKPPAKVRDVRPVFPPNLRGTNTEGKVELRAVIDVNGAVRTTETVSATNEDFEQSAAAAVRDWRFTPTLLNCVPVEVSMRVSLAFRTAPPPPPPAPAPPVPPVPPAGASAAAMPRPSGVPMPAVRPVPPVPPTPVAPPAPQAVR